MSTTTITKTFKVDGVATDPGTSITIEVRRADNNAEVVAAGTAMTKADTGTYYKTFTDPAYDLTYNFTITVVHLGETYVFSDQQEGSPTADGVVDTGDSYGFTTIGTLENKLRNLAADNNITYSAPNRTEMTRRLEQAYNAIQSVLIAKGLTAVQISTWMRGEEFQLDIATYWFGRDMGWGSKLEEERDWISVFNRFEELQNTDIVSNDGELLLSQASKPAGAFNLLTLNENLGYYP